MEDLASEPFLLRWSTSCGYDTLKTRQTRPGTHLLFLGPNPSSGQALPCGNRYASFIPTATANKLKKSPDTLKSLFDRNREQADPHYERLDHLSDKEKAIILAAMTPPAKESPPTDEPNAKSKQYDSSQISSTASYSSIAAGSSATARPSATGQGPRPLPRAKENTPSDFPPLTPTSSVRDSLPPKGVWAKARPEGSAGSSSATSRPSTLPGTTPTIPQSSDRSQAKQAWHGVHDTFLGGRRDQGESSPPSTNPTVPPPSIRSSVGPRSDAHPAQVTSFPKSAPSAAGTTTNRSSIQRHSSVQPYRSFPAAPRGKETVFLDTNVWIRMSERRDQDISTSVEALLEATEQNGQKLLFTRQIFRELEAVRSDVYTALLKALDPAAKRGPRTQVLVLGALPVRSGVQYAGEAYFLDSALLKKDTLILAELSAAAQGQQKGDKASRVHYHICTGDKALLLRARAMSFPVSVSRSYHLLHPSAIPKTTKGWRDLLQKSVAPAGPSKTQQKRTRV